MKTNENWLYDEFKQIGKDYSNQSEVEIYETSHSQFRDIQQEGINLLGTLKPTQDDILVDIGCGTGIFCIEASKNCNKVYAVDISKQMLSYAKAKSEKEGRTNIEFSHSGFLNFKIEDESVDFITSTYSFHHLPDYWKGIALHRMIRMLKKGGMMYIKDVVISEENSLQNIQNFISSQEKLGGDFLKDDAETHFREEFSTYDWVLDGLITKAGFTITSKKTEIGLIAEYFCKKEIA